MRPNRYVGARSAPALRRLAEALEPAVHDPDPFDRPEPWSVTTTEEDAPIPTILIQGRTHDSHRDKDLPHHAGRLSR